MSTQLVNQPLGEIFFDLVSNAQQSIQLCAPFLKYSVAKRIVDAKKPAVNLQLVTKINLMNFLNKTLDLDALTELSDAGAQIYNCSNLHAKMYIFDAKTLIITSANLTPSGFGHNYEYGIIVDDPALLRVAQNDFCKICNEQKTGKITAENIEKITQLLAKISPKIQTDTILSQISDEWSEIFCGDPSVVREQLTGWTRALFDQLDALAKQTLTTADFGDMIPALKALYPLNDHIPDKIRQQLQQLRDLGLIRFEARGVYTKLWQTTGERYE